MTETADCCQSAVSFFHLLRKRNLAIFERNVNVPRPFRYGNGLREIEPSEPECGRRRTGPAMAGTVRECTAGEDDEFVWLRRLPKLAASAGQRNWGQPGWTLNRQFSMFPFRSSGSRHLNLAGVGHVVAGDGPNVLGFHGGDGARVSVERDEFHFVGQAVPV